MEKKTVGVLVDKGLIPAHSRSRQEGCIPWQLKSITVPLQDTHIRIKSLEERVGLPFWSQMHSVVADFLRGFPVSFIWIDACTKSMRDKLTPQTDPQHRDSAY